MRYIGFASLALVGKTQSCVGQIADSTDTFALETASDVQREGSQRTSICRLGRAGVLPPSGA